MGRQGKGALLARPTRCDDTLTVSHGGLHAPPGGHLYFCKFCARMRLGGAGRGADFKVPPYQGPAGTCASTSRRSRRKHCLDEGRGRAWPAAVGDCGVSVPVSQKAVVIHSVPRCSRFEKAALLLSLLAPCTFQSGKDTVPAVPTQPGCCSL